MPIIVTRITHSAIVRSLLAAYAILLLSCSTPIDPDFQESSGRIQVLGTTLHFSIAVPSDYSAEHAVPLILALHYGGEPYAGMGKEFLDVLIKPALKDMKAVMVAPTCPTNAGWTSAVAELSVMALMDSIVANYTIDARRIVVTGFSAGGIGTWYYAASYPDFFTAAVPVAGEPLPAAANTLGDMPVYVVHGVNDERILIEDVAPIIMQMQDAGLNIKFVSVNGLTHYNTSGYISPLRGAIPWLDEQWGSR